MEDRIEVSTSHGQVWFHGRDTGRPVMLLLTGAFAEANVLDHAQPFLPDIDLWRAHLPGNHCPPIEPVSVANFAAAYTEALDTRAPGRPVAAVGLSTGALVVMALRARGLKSMLLVEPPLRSADCWPLFAFREQGPANWEALIEPVFGIGRESARPTDYAPLLDTLAVPALALAGDIPLQPKRPLDVMPSLVDAESRVLLAAHPRIRLEELPGVGHNVPAQAPERFLNALLRVARVAAAQ
ncbi:MAG: alpha/beta hydrolase [Pseudomonadota bacterium]